MWNTRVFARIHINYFVHHNICHMDPLDLLLVELCDLGFMIHIILCIEQKYCIYNVNSLGPRNCKGVYELDDRDWLMYTHCTINNPLDMAVIAI